VGLVGVGKMGAGNGEDAKKRDPKPHEPKRGVAIASTFPDFFGGPDGTEAFVLVSVDTDPT